MAAIANIDPAAGQDKWTDAYPKINDTIDAVNAITFNATLAQKVIEIGDWNMDTTINVSVAHGIADFTKIRSISALIRSDVGTANFNLSSADSTGLVQGFVGFVNSTIVVLERTAGGIFDNSGFNDTPFNRGWITITYEG